MDFACNDISTIMSRMSITCKIWKTDGPCCDCYIPWSHLVRMLLWLLCVNGLILQCCKQETMCVVCLWLLCVMVSSYSVVNMRPCVFVTVMCHGLILQCCEHETMWVCDCHVSMLSSYFVVNMRPCLWASCFCYILLQPSFSFAPAYYISFETIFSWQSWNKKEGHIIH